jgi:cystathionine beta-synthase
VGSVLAIPESLNEDGRGSFYVVEGIGYDFVPDVLGREDVDTWIKSSDDEAFAAARLIMREEGLLIGGSSGSALAGALKWFKTKKGQEIADTVGANVVVLLPDG